MPQLRSATRHRQLSALLASRAASEAARARRRGRRAVVGVITAHQIAQAQMSQSAVTAILLEQQIDAEAEALLNTAAFTTSTRTMTSMLDTVEAPDRQAAGTVNRDFALLVASLVQEAGRAAESVAITSRDHVYHVRQVNPPCCARCAVLAGRVYSWSTGFKRHPGCDCTMTPCGPSPDFQQSPDQLVADGLVRGLSKADMRALDDGADLNRVVNVRLKKSGLSESGTVLTRAGKPAPAGIYATAGDDRPKAVALLKKHGYLI